MKILHALPGLGLFLIFVSCQNNVLEKDTIASLSDSTSVSGLTGDSVKLVKTASIHFKVSDVKQSIRAVSAHAQALGGMIYHQNLKSVEGERKELKTGPDSLLLISAYTPQADITASVPSAQLETFLFDVADLGYLTFNSRLDIDDQSLPYLENILKQKNRVESLPKSSPVKSTTHSTLQTIALKDEITAQAISNKAIDAGVKYSTVQLHFFQNPVVRKEVIANYYISDYQLPFGKRLGAALGDGWSFFFGLPDCIQSSLDVYFGRPS